MRLRFVSHANHTILNYSIKYMTMHLFSMCEILSRVIYMSHSSSATRFFCSVCYVKNFLFVCFLAILLYYSISRCYCKIEILPQLIVNLIAVLWSAMPLFIVHSSVQQMTTQNSELSIRCFSSNFLYTIYSQLQQQTRYYQFVILFCDASVLSLIVSIIC